MGDGVETDEIEEVVEDRFDDQSFDDAPLSDPESHFDEQDLLSIDEGERAAPSSDESPLKDIWNRPALSTIPEESKIEDIPTSEITLDSAAGGRLSDGLCSTSQSTISQAFSVKSCDFITNQKASEIIQREQESFLRGHGLFIQDDPRFDRSHFEKENSWEPSIPDQSFDHFDVGSAAKNSSVSAVGFANAASESQRLQQKDPINDRNATKNPILRSDAQTRQDTGKAGVPLNDFASHHQHQQQILPVNDVRSTPQRKLIKQRKVGLGNSPRISECSLDGAQTSTPVCE